jgi:hypothetical protein
MTSRLSALASHLRNLHNGGLSWRKIRDAEFPGISHTVLRDLVVEGKVPKERRVLAALGLVGQRRERSAHEKRTRRKVAEMAKDTREKVLRKL